MISQETREIRNHALIGGSVALVLVEFERLPDWVALWSKLEIFAWWPLWVKDLILGGVGFILAFWFIGVFERRSRRKLPIVIPDLGQDVNGTWVNAVIQHGRILGVSLFTIDSSKATDRFTVDGKTFPIQSITSTERAFTLHDDPSSLHGEFWSKEGSLFGGKGMSYPFTGKQYIWREDGQPSNQQTPGGRLVPSSRFGVVYYTFEKAGENIVLNGAFLSEENSLCRVIGRQTSADKKIEKEADIKDWITRAEVREFQEKCLADFQREYCDLFDKREDLQKKILRRIAGNAKLRAALDAEVKSGGQNEPAGQTN